MDPQEGFTQLTPLYLPCPLERRVPLIEKWFKIFRGRNTQVWEPSCPERIKIAGLRCPLPTRLRGLTNAGREGNLCLHPCKK